MSTMQIEIVNVNVSTIPTAKGSYQVADVAYKNKSFQDKIEGKKVMSFSNKDVFNVLTKASFGDIFTVSRAKNDKGFWDWTAINPGTSPAVQDSNTPDATSVHKTNAPMKTGNVTPKSNYETPEERAQRQVLIVRQSSISSAVDFAIANKVKDENEVLRLAKVFENFVFGKAEAVEVKPEAPAGNFFEDMEDNLP